MRDWSSKGEAEKQATAINEHWFGLGYDYQAYAVKVFQAGGENPVYGVRSKMVLNAQGWPRIKVQPS